ncbi:hypothetical protein PHG01_00674 [Streptococcus mutans PKUSS-HG01]|nr:hypothetical protein PHG01_00674 [Streptococcus mutans PKUSS-HG01]
MKFASEVIELFNCIKTLIFISETADFLKFSDFSFLFYLRE